MEENNQLIRQSNVLTESRYDFDPIEKTLHLRYHSESKKGLYRGGTHPFRQYARLFATICPAPNRG